MVEISEEEFRMPTGRHIWTMTEHEKDAFHPRNLNSSTPIFHVRQN